MQKRYVLADLHKYGENKHGYYIGVDGIFSESELVAALYPTMAIAEAVGRELGDKIRHPHPIVFVIKIGP